MFWNGFECKDFIFENRRAKVIIPDCEEKKDVLILKTEYFNAFPEAEIELVKQGFYLCFVENDSRWGYEEDIDRKARFIEFVAAEYGTKAKCVPVGMSCGGLIAVRFAAKYPHLVACLYLDAPVMNYMSCPCGFGSGKRCDDDFPEILDVFGMKSISELICYRDMPMDKIPALGENKIPVILVAGDSDEIVPYHENGILLEEYYKKRNLPIEVYIKENCNHHPHSLDDPSPIIEFILFETVNK